MRRVFDREAGRPAPEGDEFVFESDGFTGRRDDLVVVARPDALFVSTGATLNAPHLSAPHRWFLDNLWLVTPGEDTVHRTEWAENLIEPGPKAGYRQRIVHVLELVADRWGWCARGEEALGQGGKTVWIALALGARAADAAVPRAVTSDPCTGVTAQGGPWGQDAWRALGRRRAQCPAHQDHRRSFTRRRYAIEVPSRERALSMRGLTAMLRKGHRFGREFF
ncbi:hypothetical protein ACIQZB_01680 [Streptomyces sp. NPDC097727]|uniref:hypothetical protein n=1 Tax=Streptomyces sp. NPDC097727 TaxID=3366092 RepID=UPI0038235EA7